MPTPIQHPAGYVPGRAMSFADPAGNSVTVSADTPMPVTMTAAAPAPVTGTTSANLMAGPFLPTPGRAVTLALSGNWSGSARLLRSIDGGTTRLPVTLAGAPWGEYTQNCCEAVWEETEDAATLYLDIALISGTLMYRIA